MSVPTNSPFEDSVPHGRVIKFVWIKFDEYATYKLCLTPANPLKSVSKQNLVTVALSHILCRNEYLQILDHAGNTVYYRASSTQLTHQSIQVPSGGKVTIQVKLLSSSSSVSGHFAVLNKSIDSGKDFLCSKILLIANNVTTNDFPEAK